MHELLVRCETCRKANKGKTASFVSTLCSAKLTILNCALASMPSCSMLFYLEQNRCYGLLDSQLVLSFQNIFVSFRLMYT